MKYALLVYTRRADGRHAARDLLRAELVESGEWVSAEGLADPAYTRTVRGREASVLAIDGPLADHPDVLVCFSIVDCESYDRAGEIAARVVHATGDTVEVRPIMDEAGEL